MDKLPISRGLSWRMEAAQYDGEGLISDKASQSVSLFLESYLENEQGHELEGKDVNRG